MANHSILQAQKAQSQAKAHRHEEAKQGLKPLREGALTKKLGRRWRGSGGICHACTPLDLAWGNVPKPHSLQSERPSAAKRQTAPVSRPPPASRQLEGGQATALKTVRCHPGSRAVRIGSAHAQIYRARQAVYFYSVYCLQYSTVLIRNTT